LKIKNIYILYICFPTTTTKSDSKSEAQFNFIEGHSRPVDPEGQQLGRGPNLLSLCAHSDWLFTKINTCSPEHTHTHTHKQTLCLYCPILQQQLVKKTQKVNLNTGDSTHWLATSGPAGKPENVSSDYPRAAGQSEVILTRSIHKKQHCEG